MNKISILFLAIGLIFLSFIKVTLTETVPIGMAVEFNDHAACAYISQEKGWFKEEGLILSTYESYETGMALASALVRGDIQVAYLCLVPALNVYANAQVPLKIVMGTHKYGYGLVVNPKRVKTIQDLEKTDNRIGCVREGGAVDILLHKIIDKFNLNQDRVLKNIQRMNPSKQLLAFTLGQLDAVILPEHWATMAEAVGGSQMLLTSQDIWKEMLGSVLVVKEELIINHPEIVESLVKISQRATDWINQYPQEAAEIMAQQLQITGKSFLPIEIANGNTPTRISSEILLKSMNRIKYTTELEVSIIQETIDYITTLGYIRNSFKAEKILDFSFITEK